MRLANKVFVFSEKARRRGWSLAPSPPLPLVFGRQTLAACESWRGSLATWRSVWSQGVVPNPKLKHGLTSDEEAAAFKACHSHHYICPEDYFPFDVPKLLKSRPEGLILGLKYNHCDVGNVETDEVCPMVELDGASLKLPKPYMGEIRPKPEDLDKETGADWLTGLDRGEIMQMVGYHLMSIYNPYVCVNSIDIFPCIALFDFEKESTVGLGPPLHKITPFKMLWFEDSVNVISLKIVESVVGYPISIYGTVLARDQIDFRCVYLFRRARDDPQTITSSDDTLIFTGPNRGLSAMDNMFFEINLKIKDGGTNDKDFSKCMFTHVVSSHDRQPMICGHTSHMSTVEFVYTHVGAAVEARVEVNFCNESHNFNGKVTAWTTEDIENHIILYDSEVAGAMTTTVDNDGSLRLSRCLVAVPLDHELVLDICILHEDKHLVLIFGRSDEARVCNLGSYELQVNVTWTAGMVKRRYFH